MIVLLDPVRNGVPLGSKPPSQDPSPRYHMRADLKLPGAKRNCLRFPRRSEDLFSSVSAEQDVPNCGFTRGQIHLSHPLRS